MCRAKQTVHKTGRHTRTAAEEVEEGLKHAGLVKTTVQNSVPDQMLTFQQLLIRYKGISLMNMVHPLVSRHSLCIKNIWFIT